MGENYAESEFDRKDSIGYGIFNSQFSRGSAVLLVYYVLIKVPYSVLLVSELYNILFSFIVQ